MFSRKQRTLVAACTLLGVIAAPCRAQIARVAAAQRTTEKRSGEGEWQKAGVGASLRASDRFRTGKRSKADIKFRDGSLVRLGQLSFLELRGAKHMNLVRGQLLFVALRPGRVLAGAAAAEIKGSVALIQYRNYKNSEGQDTDVAEFYLYSGLMDVVSNLRNVSLLPGQKASVDSEGNIRVGVAPPLQYFGGELHPDILRVPSQLVFAGSTEHTDWRNDPERVERDHNFTTFYNPGGFNNLENRAYPQPGPRGANLNAPLLNAPLLSASGTPSGTPAPAIQSAPSSGLQFDNRFAFSFSSRLAAATEAPTDAANTQQAAEDAGGANEEEEEGGEFDLEASAAYAHLKEAQKDKGRELGGDVALVGAFADEGAHAYGARFRGYAAYNQWFLDAAYFPLRVRTRFEEGDGEEDNRDFSAFSDLSLTYTDHWGKAQIGRQRFLSGPTQATLFGSLIRSGGREVMDAARLAPDIGDEMSLEVAYLFDAFPQKLPYRIEGNQQGVYGRFAIYKKFGNFGLNVLRYRQSDTDVDSTTGATLDFAIPIVRDRIEFYGEVGRDPFRRRLRSFGFTFPRLYEKTGWDIFLEYARLRGRDEAWGAPSEYTVRAYKKLNQHMNVVAAVSRFSGDETKFVIGLSLGARTAR